MSEFLEKKILPKWFYRIFQGIVNLYFMQIAQENGKKKTVSIIVSLKSDKDNTRKKIMDLFLAWMCMQTIPTEALGNISKSNGV